MHSFYKILWILNRNDLIDKIIGDAVLGRSLSWVGILSACRPCHNLFLSCPLSMFLRLCFFLLTTRLRRRWRSWYIAIVVIFRANLSSARPELSCKYNFCTCSFWVVSSVSILFTCWVTTTIDFWVDKHDILWFLRQSKKNPCCPPCEKFCFLGSLHTKRFEPKTTISPSDGGLLCQHFDQWCPPQIRTGWSTFNMYAAYSHHLKIAANQMQISCSEPCLWFSYAFHCLLDFLLRCVASIRPSPCRKDPHSGVSLLTPCEVHAPEH